MPRSLCWCLLLLVAGCSDDAAPEAPSESAPVPVASTFDPARTGTVSGRVTWNGPIPAPPPFIYGVPRTDGTFDTRMVPNPNRPDVDPETKAVAGAVVFLRGIAPSAAKPWDLPPVRIELKDRDIAVTQGQRRSRIGFVKRGDSASIASPGPEFHMLKVRGASFFSVPFPDPGTETQRTLDANGRVELSSGAGYYWATAHLFVDEHPYYTVTDRDGRFTFAQVPEGTMEVVAWLPNWVVAKQERNPETGLIARLNYAAPLEANARARTGAEIAIAIP